MLNQTYLTEHARRAAYRNRPRFNQAERQELNTFKDSKGQEYIRYDNGMVVKITNKSRKLS